MTAINARTVLVTLVAAWITSVITLLSVISPAHASDGRPTVVVTVDRAELGACDADGGWDVYVHTNARTYVMFESSRSITSPTGHFGPVSVTATCGDDSAPLTVSNYHISFHNL